MRPKRTESKTDLFRSHLDQIINLNHPLIRLSRQIDWKAFEEKFGTFYHPHQGRPGLPVRLLAGLTYLSRTFNLSDESVVEGFVENPYWQYFCGYEYFQHRFPLDASSLVRWRKRIGEDGIEFLLAMTIVTAKRSKVLTKRHLEKVNVDTTVQEKNITFPTDAKLYYRMCQRLVTEAKKMDVSLRQSYVRLGKKALLIQSRYAHARQWKRSRREVKRLKTFLGRVVRDIQRKLPIPEGTLAVLLPRAEKLLVEKRNSKNKLYSIHAPEVECIAKGKAHKRYEFGCKVSVATTSRDNWVIGSQAHHGNPYDGHTLSSVLEQVKRITGWNARDVYCDRGYRGHGYTGASMIHIVNNRRKNLSRSERYWRGRRAAIEPVIGHLKSDNRLSRNYLKGETGDRFNALLAGCGWNLRKLLQILFCLIFGQQDYPKFKQIYPQNMILAG